MSNGPPPESELLQPIQNLTNLIWLAQQEPHSPEKVLRYLTLADAQLLRLTDRLRDSFLTLPPG
jgi:hypothetical protein